MTTSEQINFGSGNLILIPSTANSTPVQFNSLQDFELDIKFDEKTLHGQKQFPIDVARSKGSITGKFSNAGVNGGMFNSSFFGDTAVTGQLLLASQEAATPALESGGGYAVTVSNSATFDTDCGVAVVSTGLPLTKVASSPATGEYSVSAGVYTFSSAAPVVISYTYTSASGGNKTTLTNKLMGAAPTFKAVYQCDYNGKKLLVQLNECRSNDLKMAFKNEDYMIPEINFSAFADASDNVGIISLVN